MAIFAVSAGYVLHTLLVVFPGDQWQLDLEVYRDGSANLIHGRPVYDWLTIAPQFLPFTYPPFAAVAGIPLALVPLVVAGWLWALLQVVLLWVCTGLAFARFLGRFGHRAGLAQGVIAAVLIHLQPVYEGLRFGQVNAVIVTLCLVDLTRRRAGWWPRGALVGLAAAVKLTPATFWVHFAIARRWPALIASIGAAAAATVLTTLVAPSSSAAFWTDAVLDPERLGSNKDPSNQSLRGALLRVGPSDATVQTAVWLVLVALVCVFGFQLSARLHRLGDPVAVVACVGMVAVLISPVSWIHHWHWGIVVIGALLGQGRSRARVVAALAATVVLALRLPWWGGAWPGHGPLVSIAGRAVQQGYTLFAILGLIGLWLLVARPAGQGQRSQ